MNMLRRPSSLLLVAALLTALLTACFASGPQKTLNRLAEALDKNDSAAFLAQLDMKTFAANQIKNLTREDQALSSLDSLGRMLGLGGMDDLLGSVLNMENRLQGQYTRGVSTGEMMAQCREAQSPDCPWVPESLKQAQVIELSDTAAVARVTTPARMTSWLALRKKGDNWLVVGQAILENTAKAYAADVAAPPVSGAPSARPDGGNKDNGSKDKANPGGGADKPAGGGVVNI
ncbi:MAG: hypothetical protein LUG19_08265 [Desulfovibrio sp.]|uniref:hypothetical protein n=1 Tax=Desulfovibrio sp. TaxID=885 RepID=UPI00258CAE6E|nr:hypothetical protein [Desulfovibrio sp.]MCD7984230.1 hypothetical protein [Desulfovibrio sp.]